MFVLFQTKFNLTITIKWRQT